MNSKAFIATLLYAMIINLSAKLAIFYVLEYRKSFFSFSLLKESKKNNCNHYKYEEKYYLCIRNNKKNN